MTDIPTLKSLQKRRYCTRENAGCGDQDCNGSGNGCIFEYDEARCDPRHLYEGPDWPPPRRWISSDGTHVYRTYADYLDD